MTTCSDCDQEFDLARQHYYDNVCPSCMEDESEEEEFRSWRKCTACSMRVPTDEAGSATSRGRTGTERVLVCSEGCKERIETPIHAPVRPGIEQGDDPYYSVRTYKMNLRFNDNIVPPEEE